MTEVTVVRNDDGEPVGFEARGHSLNALSGNDIVCAAISTLFEYLSHTVEDLPPEAVQFHQAPDVPHWKLLVDQAQLDDRKELLVQTVFRNAVATFRSIREEHPDACRINESAQDG